MVKHRRWKDLDDYWYETYAHPERYECSICGGSGKIPVHPNVLTKSETQELHCICPNGRMLSSVGGFTFKNPRKVVRSK